MMICLLSCLQADMLSIHPALGMTDSGSSPSHSVEGSASLLDTLNSVDNLRGLSAELYII